MRPSETSFQTASYIGFKNVSKPLLVEPLAIAYALPFWKIN